MKTKYLITICTECGTENKYCMYVGNVYMCKVPCSKCNKDTLQTGIEYQINKMEKIEQNRVILKWDVPNYGLFKATIWGGQLTDFRACESGSEPTICTSNIMFLKELRNSITDILKEIGIE